jgi:hypothetical protein
MRMPVLRLLTATALLGGLALAFTSSAGAASSGAPNIAPHVKPTCKKIKGPGTICVGPVIIHQNAYMRVTYRYEGKGSVRGHVRLGTDNPTSRKCTAGLLDKNGKTVRLHKGQTATVRKLMTVDAKWSGTFYKGSTDWGTVCGVY